MVEMGIFWYGTVGYIVVWYSRVHLYGTASFSLYCAVQYSAVLFVTAGLPLQVSLPLEVLRSD